MELKEYKCPNCGGALKIDTDTQKIKCPYCDSEFRWHSSNLSKEKSSVPKTSDDKSEKTLILYPYHSFISMSKKEERECWVIDHPDTVIPKRLQQVANDPNDNKRKLRYWIKTIIFTAVAFVALMVVLIVLLTLEQNNIITNEINTIISQVVLLIGIICLSSRIIYGLCRDKTRLGCLVKLIIIIIVFFVLMFIVGFITEILVDIGKL
ncbi:MAG: hypothetical protein LBI28_10765 [Treponema sp.]|jgi:DNA-directed RNA polymerase subunit RPC12/RpoP|nr:hypothetical protein [Treponema sp.]